MSRKTSVRGSSVELEEDKLARLQLLEAKRKLASTRRSPKPDPEKRARRGSGASGSSINTQDSQFKWVNLDGKGNWQRVKIAKAVEEAQREDDFKDEDNAGTTSGEESDQYWAELNANRETHEDHLQLMIADFRDIPDIIIANEEISLEHVEMVSKCIVTVLRYGDDVDIEKRHVLDSSETVNILNLVLFSYIEISSMEYKLNFNLFGPSLITQILQNV